MLLLNLGSRSFSLIPIGPDATDEYVHPFCTEVSYLRVGYDKISLTDVKARGLDEGRNILSDLSLTIRI